MSLVVKVSVNDGPAIDILVMQRVRGDAEADSVNLYDCAAYQPATDASGPTKTGQAMVAHRYGDGALVLVRKALSAMEA